MNNTSFVDLDNTRFDDQREIMERIRANNECPFCLENLRKYHIRPILKEGTYWVITENAWPYENTRVHLLAILKTHAEKLSELPPGAGDELIELAAWAEKEYAVKGGGLTMRFGDTNHSAGTVLHLHAQFIAPDIEKPDFKPVRVKLGKEWEKRS